MHFKIQLWSLIITDPADILAQKKSNKTAENHFMFVRLMAAAMEKGVLVC